jgi:hypothetical protein
MRLFKQLLLLFPDINPPDSGFFSKKGEVLAKTRGRGQFSESPIVFLYKGLPALFCGALKNLTFAAENTNSPPHGV